MRQLKEVLARLQNATIRIENAIKDCDKSLKKLKNERNN